MKKYYTSAATWLLALMAVLTFTSCDEDAMLAYDLDGVWQGSVASEFFNYRYGRSVEYTDIEICFDQRGAWEAGGTGYEIDLYARSYTKSYFRWTVRNGRIYIDYDDTPYTVVIRDFDIGYHSGRQYFSGYFDQEGTGRELAHFDLVKVASSSYYENRYFARENRDTAATDSIPK
jgi:hypothetical protein